MRVTCRAPCHGFFLWFFTRTTATYTHIPHLYVCVCVYVAFVWAWMSVAECANQPFPFRFFQKRKQCCWLVLCLVAFVWSLQRELTFLWMWFYCGPGAHCPNALPSPKCPPSHLVRHGSKQPVFVRLLLIVFKSFFVTLSVMKSSCFCILITACLTCCFSLLSPCFFPFRPWPKWDGFSCVSGEHAPFHRSCRSSDSEGQCFQLKYFIYLLLFHLSPPSMTGYACLREALSAPCVTCVTVARSRGCSAVSCALPVCFGGSKSKKVMKVGIPRL